jgi:ABC-2 type transport system permease protein
MLSDLVPFVIIALVFAFAFLRLSRTGRLPGRAPRAAASLPEIRLLPLVPADVGLVAARELRARVRSRAYRAGTVLVLGGITAAIVIPALGGGRGATPRAAVAGCPAAPASSAHPASYVGLLLVFFMLTQYNAWTLTGVLEEKSSRVVEVLLAAITPARLLAGKVLGIGLAAFVQAAVAAGLAVGLARATHSGALTGVTGLVAAATLTWLVLGYAFYAWLYAAAGSTADRPEQAQSLLLPLALPAVAGFVVATAAANSGHPSLLLQVLAYLPPTAPFAMPALVGLGAVSWWQFTLSSLLSLACTVAVARAAVAVYRGSILHAGGRPPLRQLLARSPAAGQSPP